MKEENTSLFAMETEKDKPSSGKRNLEETTEVNTAKRMRKEHATDDKNKEDGNQEDKKKFIDECFSR